MNRPARFTPDLAAVVAAGRGPSVETIDGLVRASTTTLGRRGVAEETARLTESVLGVGVLADVLSDEAVTDVLVNGDGSVWVDRGTGVRRADRAVAREEVRPLAVRLATMAGRRLDDAQPWVDGLLPRGIRLHAILPPLADLGAHISLRVPRVSPASIAELVEIETCCPALGEILGEIVRGGLSFLVVGGTGAGKTTLLGGLLAVCDASERLVLVEDVRELGPAHPHVVRLQGRAPNVEGRGGVGLVDLVRQALRMRPDRLIVGEVRGAEVRELLAALNTGHRGSAGTLHANGVGDVPARLQALGSLAGLTPAAVDAQLLGGIDIVVAMRRDGSRRRVTEIGVVRPGPGGVAAVEVAVSSPRFGTLTRGPAWATLTALRQRG